MPFNCFEGCDRLRVGNQIRIRAGFTIRTVIRRILIWCWIIRRIRNLAVCRRFKCIVLFYGAIEIWIGKMAGNVPEIKNSEEHLAEIFPYACATADDLLKLGHTIDFGIQDDEFDHLYIHAGG